ncbi:MAG: hypothetical protein DHS20C21_02070 [Gemmatimonadota bacterium]|nr:MAG: hypothetical protein DHS20C21_02070 [Gemmatimonadota bacterium]
MANEKRLAGRVGRNGAGNSWFLAAVFVWVAVLAIAIGEAHGEESGTETAEPGGNADLLALEAREAASRDAHGEAVAAALAAIQLDPDREGELALLLGHQLTWQDRSAEAIPWFERHLEHSPGDREGRLGLARAQSWSGDLESAATTYRGLLEDDPADVDAQIGVARMEAWSGRHGAAAREYGRAVEMDPGSDEAILGLAHAQNLRGKHRLAEGLVAPLARAGNTEARVEWARALYWMGEGDAALELLDPMDEPGATELTRAIRDDRRPRVDLHVERWIDVDDQELRSYGASIGRGFSRGLHASADVTHEWVDEPGISAIGANRFTLGGSWRPERRVALNLFATVETVGGALRRQEILDVGDGETVTGEDVQETKGYWDAWVTWNPRDWTRVDLASGRTPVRTPRARARGIHTDGFSASLDQRLSDRLVGRLAVSHGTFSDDNTRRTAGAELEVGPFAAASRAALFVSGGASRVEFEESPDHGYYSPSSYDSFFAGARLELNLPEDVTVEADGRLTSEREESEDRFGVASGGVTIRWTPDVPVGVSVFARKSTSRFDTSEGYGRRGVGASIFFVL